MENAAFRSFHGSIASIPVVSPRKQHRGVTRIISTDETTDCSPDEKEKSRFFRLLSPKKALARKAKKNAIQKETTQLPVLTTESMDAIGILPFDGQGDAHRGRVAARRGNISSTNQALRQITRSGDDDSSVRFEDCFVVQEVKPQQKSVLTPSSTQGTPYCSPVHGSLYSPSKGSRKSPRRKGPSKPDFQASIDIGELLNSPTELFNSIASDCKYEHTVQEDELFGKSLGKSRTDVGRSTPTVSPIRKKRFEVVDETQCWTTRECRKTRPAIVSEQRVEYKRNLGDTGEVTGSTAEELRLIEEERRLVEEEQEKEMILLAMERSLADAAELKKRQEQVSGVSCRRTASPHRVPYDQNEISDVIGQGDEDEIARREQEMIRRAMEMSMRDF